MKSEVATEIEIALEKIDALLDLLHEILDALDDMGLNKAAINVVDAIENLGQLREMVLSAQNNPAIAIHARQKIEKIRRGLSIPRYQAFG